jgi:hypothetical protein
MNQRAEELAKKALDDGFALLNKIAKAFDHCARHPTRPQDLQLLAKHAATALDGIHTALTVLMKQQGLRPPQGDELNK